MKKTIAQPYLGILLLFMAVTFSAETALAGCGFGARTYGRTLLAELFAMGETISTPFNSSSITSGTSGCSNSGFVNREWQETFVAETYHQLEEESSKGHGPYLTSMARILGCPESLHPTVSEVAHQNFSSLFEITTESRQRPKAFLSQMKRHIESNPHLQGQCKLI
ncbi:MAG: DUF3015 family protein [SAR324 cluster bacterium]|nr:DUF3015 family protein [SAR324 cluster bacterium]